MKTSRIHFGLLSFALSLLCSAASGQPVMSHADSLQWMVARADAIVRGTVEDVVALNPGDPFSEFHQVTVQTRSTIKGQPGDRVCFVSAPRKPYADLKKKGHEGLFFLVRSQFDFNRQTRDYFFSRCPMICKNTIDLGDDFASVASFDVTGLTRIEGAKAILAKVEQYAGELQRDKRGQGYGIREPDHRAFSGYDSIITVPVNHSLYAVAKKWAAAGGIQGRVGRGMENYFAELIEFEAAKTEYAAEQQVPTDWHHARTLSIDSLEWMTADSDAIIRGTIEDLVLVKLGDRDDRISYDNTLDRHLVKLRVSERIKGESDDSISFVIENGGKLSEWQQQKTPLVVFLKDRSLQVQDAPKRLVAVATYSDKRPVLRYAGRGPDTKAIIAFDKGHPKMFSARLEWIDGPSEMLAIIRGYLAQAPSARESRSGDIPSVSFKPPEAFLKGSFWEGEQYVRITFPIDAYLEKQARRWITSHRKEDRWLGAYALVYFKSDENAEALERLLDDPGIWTQPMLVSIHTHLRVTYLVRWEAWTILQAWGYDVPRPIFKEPLSLDSESQ